MKTPAANPQPWPPAWYPSLRRRVTRWCAQGAGTAWVVAVSGGSDSVGLLRALHHLAPELGLRLVVAHLNHGVRGEAGRDDAAFVAELAARLGLPFELGQWRPQRPAHFETDARHARYDWLRQVAQAQGATAVATGHTRDDQAETIVHRIVRGTGLRGLAGIAWRRPLSGLPPVLLVRPLLAVSRQEIRDGLQALGQGYREDVSNTDETRTRARIRHDLLPRLAADYNPSVVEAIARLGELAASSQRMLECGLQKLEQEVVVVATIERIEVRGAGLRDQPLFLRAELLRRLWRRAGWPESGMSARRWRRLARRVSSVGAGARDIGGGVVLKNSADGSVVLSRRATRLPAPHDSPGEAALDVPGTASWGVGRVVAAIDPQAPEEWDETIDLDQVTQPLMVRGALRGDRFAPLGMGGQGMSLVHFLRGRKIGVKERGRVPLLCDARGIIWVVGHRISDRVRVTDDTRRLLSLRWETQRPAPEGA